MVAEEVLDRLTLEQIIDERVFVQEQFRKLALH